MLRYTYGILWLPLRYMSNSTYNITECVLVIYFIIPCMLASCRTLYKKSLNEKVSLPCVSHHITSSHLRVISVDNLKSLSQ